MDVLNFRLTTMSSLISDKDAAEASSSTGGGESYIKASFIDVTSRQGKEDSSAFSSESLY